MTRGISGWTAGGTSNSEAGKGRFDAGINPHTGSYDFYGHTGRLIMAGQRAVAPVPEPSSLVLVASGAAMAGFLMFRRKRGKTDI